MGGFNMFEALATLAYDGPRAGFARRELIAAMRMEEQQHLEPARDDIVLGRRVRADAIRAVIVSGARGGWRRRRRASICGIRLPMRSLQPRCCCKARAGNGDSPAISEVRLPKDFPYEQADAENLQPIASWSSLGVTWRAR